MKEKYAVQYASQILAGLEKGVARKMGCESVLRNRIGKGKIVALGDRKRLMSF